MNAQRDDKTKQMAREKPAAFPADIGEIRRRARQRVERDTVTKAQSEPGLSGKDIESRSRYRNRLRALRDNQHHYMASGIYAQAIAEELSSDETQFDETQFSDRTRTQSRS